MGVTPLVTAMVHSHHKARACSGRGKCREAAPERVGVGAHAQ
jgi:hypothetical protein